MASAKFIMLGDIGIGKSSLLLRFIDGTFNPEARHISIDWKSRTIDLDGDPIKLVVWDTAGQERFRTITSSYYRDARGLLLGFDLSDRESFDQLGIWQQDIERYADDTIAAIMLVGCKCDLPRAVGREEAQALADQRGYLYVETSAKLGTNVDYAFRLLASAVQQKRQDKERAIGLVRKTRHRCGI